jgi:hypothetical protein
MLLIGISVSLLLLACALMLAVVVKRRRSARSGSAAVCPESSAVPEALLESEQMLTRQLLAGGIVPQEYREAMAELARQNSGSRRVT